MTSTAKPIYYGKTISSAEIEDNELLLEFSDGTGIRVYDGGQSCCESRYLTCDDDVADLVGGALTDIVFKNGPDIPDEDGEHETGFVDVQTTRGCITLTTHNEHNGYYSGFHLVVRECPK